MAGSAQKGARAPESSKPESSKRDERETPLEQAAVSARRGPQPPAGVVEDSTTRRSETRSEEQTLAEDSGPSQSRAAEKSAAKSIVIGRDREAVVSMDMAAPFSQVVVLDRLLDPHTGLVVETIQEARTEEETRKELGKVRREAAKRAEGA